jgi:hypothetical protein
LQIEAPTYYPESELPKNSMLGPLDLNFSVINLAINTEIINSLISSNITAPDEL